MNQVDSSGRRLARSLSIERRMESCKGSLAETGGDKVGRGRLEARRPIHFLVGMSRSGITPLSRCLNSHPEIAVFGQSRFWGRCYIKPESPAGLTREQLRELEDLLCSFDWSATLGANDEGRLQHLSLSGLNALIRKTLGALDAPSRPGVAFVRIAQAIGEAERKPCVIEKTPHHLNWITRILAELPDSRFLVLLAMPYTFAFILRQQRDMTYHPIAAALLWRACMIAYRRAKRRHGDSILPLDIGELARDHVESLEKTADFLGVQKAPMRELPNFMAAVLPDDHLDQLLPIDIFWMNRASDSVRFDMGDVRRSAAGVSPEMLFRSLTSFPRWGAGLVQTMRGNHKGSLPRYLLNWLVR